MNELTLKAQSREILGKKVNSLRRGGLTPANLYGHGLASMALQVPSDALRQALAQAGRTTMIDLEVDDGEVRPVFVRGVQWHPRSSQLLHVDFYQVRMDEPIMVKVPLVFVGEASAADAPEAMLLHGLATVEVEGLPNALPHHIEVNLSGLVEIDQAIRVRELTVADGITIHTDPESVVVKVARRRMMVPEEEEVKPKVKAAPAAEAPEAETKES